MISFPNAKINLGLNVLNRRKDGYHDISTVMAPIGFRDVLEILPRKGDGISFNQTGLNIPGDKNDNLCLEALRLMQKKVGTGNAGIHLHKVISSGAGLGGGSSDGACTLLMLNELFNAGLSMEELSEMALELGSDCPFFIRNKPVYATGRGEVMEEISLKLCNKSIILVMPGINVSTAWAYSQLTPTIPEMSVRKIVASDIRKWRELLVNDFEVPVFAEFPQLRQIKESLYEKGAVYASMSGSGSAIYGIFDEADEEMERDFPGATTWSGLFWHRP